MSLAYQAKMGGVGGGRGEDCVCLWRSNDLAKNMYFGEEMSRQKWVMM